MRTIDVIGTAIGNSFRSKLRTTLTVIAIFIGAFTLTITNGLGTGINNYINSTVNAIGAQDVLTVTKVATDATASGPKKYDPSLVAASGNNRPGTTVEALTSTDITKITAVSGVKSVQPTLSITPNYIQSGSGTKYTVNATGAVPGIKLQLAAGSQPSASSSDYQIAIPVDYVKALGFSSNSAAIGSTVHIGLTDAARASVVVDATVVGVAEAGLSATEASTTNAALTQKLYDTQSVGLTGAAKDRYSQASVTFDSKATAAQITQLKDRLTTAGYDGKTVADQIGTFKTVIDAIVLVLNAFAIIALLAASFGIVNTLLMSVQERTREIGLMKAMGMGSGKVFGLFSFEAVFIGFLGSAIGAGIAILIGTGISGALASSVFSGLPGLTIIAFTPGSIVTIILIVMAIAFVAGTLPAAKAARQDPIESLRYE